MKKMSNYIRSYFSNINLGHLAVAVLTITFMSVEPSSAQTFTGLQTVLTNIQTFITGPFGTAAAIIGLICVGVAFLSGRMDWTYAIAVVIGIAIIFGAVNFIGAGFGA